MKKILFFLLIISSCFADANERWNILSEEVNHWCDRLGMPIDPKIKKMVVALNFHGFKTTCSCEGHVDWGRGYPFVDIEFTSDELNKCKEELKKTSLKMQEYNRNHPAPPEVCQAHFKAQKQYEKAIASLVLPLESLLEEFYSSRQVSYSSILHLNRMQATWYELRPMGASRQIILGNEEKEMRIQEYQQEMDDFAEFLKNAEG